MQVLLQLPLTEMTYLFPLLETRSFSLISLDIESFEMERLTYVVLCRMVI